MPLFFSPLHNHIYKTMQYRFLSYQLDELLLTYQIVFLSNHENDSVLNLAPFFYFLLLELFCLAFQIPLLMVVQHFLLNIVPLFLSIVPVLSSSDIFLGNIIKFFLKMFTFKSLSLMSFIK